MKASHKLVLALATVCCLTVAFEVRPATSPVNTRDVLPNTDKENIELFFEGKQAFLKKRTVADGLGPVFNAQSCASCHQYPRAGGSGDLTHAVNLAARRDGDRFDSLAQCGGPFFQKLSVAGVPRKEIPSYANLRTRRLPPNLFGAGLIEEIPESLILTNARKQPNEDGIAGHPNYINGELGRFGYKARVASIFEFMFLASRDELGLTSVFSPVETRVGCEAVVKQSNEPKASSQDIFHLMYFVKFSVPLKPISHTIEQSKGQEIFGAIGCAQCHVPSFNTGRNKIKAFDHVEVPLYSDLLLHNMGDSLADGFEEGLASGRD